MTGAARTPFQIILIKVPKAYSRVEYGQSPMIDWICLFVHTWYVTLCAQLCHFYHSYVTAFPSNLSALKTLLESTRNGGVTSINDGPEFGHVYSRGQA